MQTHLKKMHAKEYEELCSCMGLKHSNQLSASLSQSSASLETSKEPFTISAWIDKLVQWVTVDDQVSTICQVFCK